MNRLYFAQKIRDKVKKKEEIGIDLCFVII